MFYFLVFIEGYIGLAYQMLFIRQLTPEVGASAVTSSWIIGFFLLALAIGYKQGGKDTKEPLQVLSCNLMKSGILVGLTASSVFIELFFTIVNSLLPSASVLSLVLYCIFFVAPAAYWMGQSLPLLIQKSEWGVKTSEISGNALYLSTIGSFVGAIVTTNVFLVLWGATYTLLGVSLLALLLGMYLNRGRYKFIMLPFAAMLIFIHVFMVDKYGLISTAFSDVHIVNDDIDDEIHIKNFLVNGTVMSLLRDGQNGAWYINEYFKMIRKNNISDSNVLVLGAGGFVAHLGNDDNHYTYVDIDGDLKAISESKFLERPITANFVGEDARRYLIDNKQQQDVIFMDVFSASTIPAHLVTVEFFELVRDRIAPGGYLFLNSIMDYEFTSNYSQKFHATLMSVFPFCERTLDYSNYPFGNVVYECKKRMENIERYSDNFNEQEFDYINMVSGK